MKDSSKTNRDLIAEISLINERIRELEQPSSEKIREENERCARQLTVLHKTSIELAAELDLEALLQSIARRSLDLIGGTTSNVYIYRPEEDLMERVVTVGPTLIPSKTTRRRGEGMVGQTWAKGAPMLINDYHAWPERTKAVDS